VLAGGRVRGWRCWPADCFTDGNDESRRMVLGVRAQERRGQAAPGQFACTSCDGVTGAKPGCVHSHQPSVQAAL
jgi:hypothetical protein